VRPDATLEPEEPEIDWTHPAITDRNHWTYKLLIITTTLAAGYWIVRCLQGVM
jgi:hypothetical protein